MNEHDLTEQQPMIELMVQTSRIWGTRIFADGRVHEYSDKEVRFVDGHFQEEPIPPAWRPLTHLTAKEVNKINLIIEEIDYFLLPAELAIDRQLQDGTKSIWKVAQAGKSHEVRRRRSPNTVDSGLERLRKAMEEMTALALRRDRQP